MGQILTKPVHRHPLASGSKKKPAALRAVGLCDGHQAMHISRRWPLWVRPARPARRAWVAG
jgi:hypothetical protein